jgi:hypothetical protein
VPQLASKAIASKLCPSFASERLMMEANRVADGQSG